MAESSLADLPVPRQEYLLRRLGWRGYDSVDRSVRRRSRTPCRVPSAAELPALTTALGDDDLYHLLVDGELACVQARIIDERPGHFEHYSGVPSRDRIPEAAELVQRTDGRWTATWTMRLSEVRAEPTAIARVRRCARFGDRDWPPVCDDSPRGRIRTTLIAHGGLSCHACGGAVGTDVDHDYRTGMVRGLVCKSCNFGVDMCPHPTGCRWGDYLNNPPAAALRLAYA